MCALFAESLWTVPASRLFPWGLLLVAAILAAFVALEMQRAAKDSATKKDSMEFMSPYHDGNGMSVFFDTSEDPSDRPAHRVLAHKRRQGL